MLGIPNDADTRGEIVGFKTSDDVPLHGALYTSSSVPARDIAVIGTHGSGASFYTSVTGILCPELPSRGYTALSMNLRSHDRFDATAIFEDCEKDLAAGVEFMKSRGYERIVLFGHSISVTQICFYMARSQDPAVVGIVLSAGHDDLRGISWRNWETLVDDPKVEQERVLAHCRELVEKGDGDHLFVIPWWRPDPKLNLRQNYRAVSAKTYVSYRSPESNCNASLWAPEIKMPILFIGHTVVDTTASPEMTKRLRELATGSPATEYVELDCGHFYVGHEEELIGVVTDWLGQQRP